MNLITLAHLSYFPTKSDDDNIVNDQCLKKLLLVMNEIQWNDPKVQIEFNWPTALNYTLS